MSGQQLSHDAVQHLVSRIARAADAVGRQVCIMEVCGTHTVAICRSGLRSILPESVRLISGPGCPVCVTPAGYIDRAIAISRLPDVTIATYGDMMRVTGSEGALELERARGADVRIVYSAMDALELARQNPDRRVVFLAVGFETTVPGIAATVLAAKSEGCTNLYMLAAPKVIPPAMEAVLSAGAPLDAFLCPGHVSVIIGSHAYEHIAREHSIPCVVAGFEPAEILLGIAMCVEQAAANRAEVEVAYRSAVLPDGNPAARAVLDQAFEAADVEWRGLGVIPASGLALRERFASMDAALAFDVTVPEAADPPGCRCGEVLSGLIGPEDCPLFGNVCTTTAPVGPCMVSSEGTCAAHFKYGFGDRPGRPADEA